MSDRVLLNPERIYLPVHHEPSEVTGSSGRWAIIDSQGLMIATTRSNGGEQLAKKICNALNALAAQYLQSYL